MNTASAGTGTLEAGLTVPPVLSTAGVPQGAHFLREWGAPFLRRLRRNLPLRALQVVRWGVPRGAHFVRERGVPRFPAAGVPQGAHFVRERGAPRFPAAGVPQGAHFVRERGALSVLPVLLLLPVFAACTGGGPGSAPAPSSVASVQQALVAAVERSVPAVVNIRTVTRFARGSPGAGVRS